MVCPTCGEENPERFRWCGSCGAELAAAAAPARKVVTLVFADVTGSTALGERLDAESVRWVMSGFFEIAKGVIERHGGTVEKFVGDAVMAAFGIPLVREDDAVRGVRAAAELRDRARAFSLEVADRYGTGIGVRIGVNTGEVVAGDAAARQTFASGDAVNVAARLEQAAAPGEVLLGEATFRLVRDAVTAEEVEPLALKGKAEAVPAWRLVAVTAGAAGIRRRLDAPLVGRASELAALVAAWRRAVDGRQAEVVTVAAPAGAGRPACWQSSRSPCSPRRRCSWAAASPTARASRTGRSRRRSVRPPGSTPTTRPTSPGPSSPRSSAARRTRATSRRASAARSASPGAPAAREETFWAIRKLFEALARRRPLVVVLDDLHWAEETLLELVDHLAAWARDVPLLLVCATRPELLERRPPAAGAAALVLAPLDADAAGALMHWELDAAPLPPALREDILATSEGNPLFVQELVRMLIEDGAITRADGGWRVAGDVHGLAMPATIQALLAARLDQLGVSERDVAQRASVVGHVFSRGAVHELCDAPAPRRCHGPSADARPQGADRAGGRCPGCGGRVPLRSHPRSRRRLRRARQEHARRAARALRELDRDRARGPPGGGRGDPRLPPGAGRVVQPRARP